MGLVVPSGTERQACCSAGSRLDGAVLWLASAALAEVPFLSVQRGFGVSFPSPLCGTGAW